MTYYLILMMAVADRIRGDTFQPVHLELNHRLSSYIVLGWTFAALTGHGWDWLTLPIGLMLVAGASSGLSEPLGALINNRPMNPAQLEWWQFGRMKQSALLATFFRGFMWGLPVALLSYFDRSLIWAIPSYMLALPTSVLIARQWLKSDWEYMEFLRGAIAGTCFVIFRHMAHS
jgi:hypothetical protein